jgi:DNA transformation protein and related proteins
MGEKGVKQTKVAYEMGEALVKTLSVIGDVNGRKMFGGYGIFTEDAMFAMVSSKGDIHFKVDDSNRQNYEAAGSLQFHNMPYYQLPEAIFQNEDVLFAWAKESMAIAQASKKKKK